MLLNSAKPTGGGGGKITPPSRLGLRNYATINFLKTQDMLNHF